MKKLGQDVKDQIYALSKGGMKYRAIAKKLGISFGAVQNHSCKDDASHGKYNSKQKDEIFRNVHKLASDKGLSAIQISKQLGLSKEYVYKLLKTLPKPSADDLIDLPKSHAVEHAPYVASKPGTWLVLSDVHVPYHHEVTLRHAIRESKDRNVVGIVLNGDFLDCHDLSDHDKDPSAVRYNEEIKVGIQVLKWIRKELPTVKIIYKLGNHEERLDRYILGRAPALFELEFASVASLLHCKDYGVEVVKDKRPIMLGKLHLLHGHEYRGGGGVNPARWIYLKARSVTMVGHFHKTSEHHARNIADKSEAAWSTGCACTLKPHWLPNNDWNHGYAFVTFTNNGDFDVTPRRVINGRVA